MSRMLFPITALAVHVLALFSRQAHSSLLPPFCCQHDESSGCPGHQRWPRPKAHLFCLCHLPHTSPWAVGTALPRPGPVVTPGLSCLPGLSACVLRTEVPTPALQCLAVGARVGTWSLRIEDHR